MTKAGYYKEIKWVKNTLFLLFGHSVHFQNIYIIGESLKQRN